MEPGFDTRVFIRRWVLATMGGWLLGIVMVAFLGGALEGIGIGGQFPLGIFMGMGVGYAQWRVARRWFGATHRWIWMSIVGMTAPLLVTDIFGMWWRAWSVADNVMAILLATAAGGALAGWLQRRCLESRSVRGNLWVVMCGVGWAVAAGVTLLVMVPRHPESALDLCRNLGALPLGGAVLGATTAAGLVWVMKEERAVP